MQVFVAERILQVESNFNFCSKNVATHVQFQAYCTICRVLSNICRLICIWKDLYMVQPITSQSWESENDFLFNPRKMSKTRMLFTNSVICICFNRLFLLHALWMFSKSHATFWSSQRTPHLDSSEHFFQHFEFAAEFWLVLAHWIVYAFFWMVRVASLCFGFSTLIENCSKA